MPERAIVGEEQTLLTPRSMSIYGFHMGKLPEITHACRRADEEHDKAECAMCQTLIEKRLWHDHEDLQIPAVQAAITELFMELMANDVESFFCPFPETEKCRSLRVSKRPRPR